MNWLRSMTPPVDPSTSRAVAPVGIGRTFASRAAPSPGATSPAVEVGDKDGDWVAAAEAPVPRAGRIARPATTPTPQLAMATTTVTAMNTPSAIPRFGGATGGAGHGKRG